MLEAILGLARALRLTTVAEGIEESEQHEAMLSLGCTLGQGYLFARPLGGQQVEALMLGAAAAADGLAGYDTGLDDDGRVSTPRSPTQ